MRRQHLEDDGLSPRELRRLRDREDILAAAAELFAGRGFRSTSMQAVAERAGFSVGKLYTFFEGKDAIFDDLMQRLLDETLDVLNRADDPSLPPLERIRRQLVTAFDHANRNRNLLRVSIQERLMDERRLEKSHRDAYAEHLVDCLEQAVAQRALPPLNPRLFALMVIGACDELAFELGARDVENPFTPIPELVMNLMIMPLVRTQRGSDPEARP